MSYLIFELPGRVRCSGSQLTVFNLRTGRWRTQWVVDQAAEKVEGTILVEVHYYEQGNVRLQPDERESR